jgi:hypothetical protein
VSASKRPDRCLIFFKVEFIKVRAAHYAPYNFILHIANLSMNCVGERTEIGISAVP